MHAKDAFDPIRVANADLDVRFFVKPRVRINRIALYEDALHRINRRLIGIPPHFVEHGDNGAI
jgi:hypothetical protein